jgi:hypothetical protein
VPSQPKRVLKCRTAKPDIRRCCGNRRFGLARGQVVSLTPIFLVWPYLHLLVSVRVAHNRRRKRQRASGILRRVPERRNASGKVYVSDGEQRAHDATLRRAAPAAPAAPHAPRPIAMKANSSRCRRLPTVKWSARKPSESSLHARDVDTDARGNARAEYGATAVALRLLRK